MRLTLVAAGTAEARPDPHERGLTRTRAGLTPGVRT